MLLVDVHAHLDMNFPDLPEVLQRAENAGVVAVIAQGVHHESNQRVLGFAQQYPMVKAALGLYPLNAPNVTVHDSESNDHDRSVASVDETLKFIREHAKEIVAIGEVGIDLKGSDDEKRQIENFIKILRLANELKKPVIIHSRKAEKLILDLLEEAKQQRVILHCFSGSRKLVRRAIDLGFHLTVTSNANRLEHFQMIARETPLSQLFTETDAPFLSPERGERNEPRNVRVAVEVIAREKGLTTQEVARHLYMNYQRMFL